MFGVDALLNSMRITCPDTTKLHKNLTTTKFLPESVLFDFACGIELKRLPQRERESTRLFNKRFSRIKEPMKEETGCMVPSILKIGTGARG